VAGQCPPEVTIYLRERPEAGPAIAAFFARARATGFTDWETLSRALGNGPAATATEAAAAGR